MATQLKFPYLRQRYIVCYIGTCIQHYNALILFPEYENIVHVKPNVVEQSDRVSAAIRFPKRIQNPWHSSEESPTLKIDVTNFSRNN